MVDRSYIQPPKNVPKKLFPRPANGPNEIYKPYLERFYAFKTPVLRSEGSWGGLRPPPTLNIMHKFKRIDCTY